MAMRALEQQPMRAGGVAGASLSPAEQGPAWNLGDLYRSVDDPRVIPT